MKPLLRKAWLETRSRFLAAATVLTILGVSTVVRAPATMQGWEAFNSAKMSYPLYIWLSLSHGFLQFLWIVSAVIFGLGGLLRERAAGTSSFTLGLPASRAQHVTARAIVGAAESVALGFIPGIIVAAISPLVGLTFPLSQSLLFGIILVAAGMIFYALGFFLSHALQGEYAAPGIALGLIAAIYVFTKLPRFDALNVFDAMDGKRHLVGKTFLLGSSLPLTPIAFSLTTAILLVALSVWRVRRLDF